MATIFVNDTTIEIGDDEKLNCIQAADRAGVKIPFYCWHPGLSVVASCRMCLIETGTKDDEGSAQMVPKLVPACQTPAKHGTVIRTDSEKVKANQQFVQECLLVDHPIDCPICDQAGECWLQDYYFDYGHETRRADIHPFSSRRKDIGEHVSLFVDRCIMCSRCVRFTREISGSAELAVIQRGHHSEIDVVDGQTCDNKLSGNVVDICPVGALCSKDNLYQQRAWFLKSHSSICTSCSSGCSIVADENKQTIYRLRPRYNPNANDWWMCDIGRHGFKYVHDNDRLLHASRKDNGSQKRLDPEETVPVLRETIAAVLEKHVASSFVTIFSPFLTCEESFLLAKALKEFSSEIKFALGPSPVDGEDETFANGFTIHSERAPNRCGVTEILKHFDDHFLSFETLVSDLQQDKYKTLFVTGGYPKSWWTNDLCEYFEKSETLIYHDIFDCSATKKAHLTIPAVTFAEKEGSYVNHALLFQTTDRIIRPRGECRGDGQLFWELLQRTGLYSASQVREELAEEITFFSDIADSVPESGVFLGEKHPLNTSTKQDSFPGSITHPIPDPRRPDPRTVTG